MDYGHEMTEKELKRLEKKIYKRYEKAYRETKQKADKYLAKFNTADAEKRKLVKAKLLSEADYIKWRESAILTGKHWEDMADTLAKDMVNADKMAVAMISDKIPDFYAMNANYGTYEIESGLGINTSWTMYDHSTVLNLMRKEPEIMPKLDIPKDKRWNRQKIHSAITQGVLQGDSIPDISKRLRAVTNMDCAAALRNARTYTTAAENKGRVDSYERAKALGIELEKEWMATPDGRTRDSHVDLDGERCPVDGTFSNGCRYPGDPVGDPAEVYNCRCTLVAAVKKRDYSNDARFTRLPEGMTYDDWKEHKLNPNYGKSTSSFKIVNGKDISRTWTRRNDKFAFEIDDVINAQGFDGKPRIVSAKEFDKAVKDANDGNGLIAQRIYSAPDQETLDAYRKQLYEGEWYVDCSVNGADRGQGMYTVANYSSDTHGIAEEIKYYQNYNSRTHGYDFSNVETLTLDSSARIADYRTEFENFQNQERIFRQGKMSEYIHEKISEMPVSEKSKSELENLAKYNFGVGGTRASEWDVINQSKELNNREFARTWGKFQSDISKKDYEDYFMDGFKKVDDFGSHCALKGYDAIRAPGERDVDSYTIVLNRTKLIIKEP